MPRPMEDISGSRFGRLTVLEKPVRIGKTKHYQVRCRCDCGQQTTPRLDQLRRGTTISCGCWGIEKRASKGRAQLTTHGKSKTRVYRIWAGIRNRCLNPQCGVAFLDYGAKGVTVDPVWAAPDGFTSFYAHVGEPPSPKHTLDRIDTARGYHPGNVRWATPVEQARNRRSNLLLTAFGRTQCMAAWVEETGIKRETIRARLTAGLTPEEALTRPLERRDPTPSSIAHRQAIAHRPSSAKEYKHWFQMVRRCTDTRSASYPRYGGRGITVCPQWQGREGYRTFLSDVGPAPDPKATLDRINNAGNYEPGNVRWADVKTQARNRG